VSLETRTPPPQIRAGKYGEEQLSIYLTGRRYGSLDVGETFVSAYDQIAAFCEQLLADFVLENVLRPVQQAIVIK
jgi:hypothetical protein